MSEAAFIHIRNWDRFQRFKDRRPTWLRVHLDLHRNDDYLGLTGHRRAILVGLWIEYASRLRQAPDDSFTICRGLAHSTATLSRQLALKVTSRDLDALNHAGFITFSGTECVTVRAVSAPLEVKKLDKNLARAREVTDQEQAEAAQRLTRAENFVRNAGVQYEPPGFEEELARFDLTPDEYQQVHDLYDHLRPAALVAAATNGAEPETQDELPWEGEEPPVVVE